MRGPLTDVDAIIRRARERLAAARTGGLPGIGPLSQQAEPSVAATLDRLALAGSEALTEEEKEAEARRKKVEQAVARAKGGNPGQFGIQAELHADPAGARACTRRAPTRWVAEAFASRPQPNPFTRRLC